MKRRDMVNIGGLGRQSLGQHFIVLTFLTPSCPTYNPSVWHPTHRILRVIQGADTLVL